jgi:hypothetical protein
VIEGKRKVLKNILKQFGKRWFICVIFGFDLLILVALSEVVRNIFVGLTPNTFNLGNWLVLFFWIFLLVPLFILPLWYTTPYAIKKLLVTFGLSEESPIIEKTEKKEKDANKKTANNLKRFIWSKTFWLIWIGIFIIFILCITFVASIWFNNEFANRFMPTSIGLAFNFFFLIVFFNIWEYLEWKPVRDRVMRRIGNQLFDTIWSLDSLVDAEIDSSPEEITEVDWYKLSEKKLNALITGKFKVTPISDKKITVSLSEGYNRREILIGEIIGNYGKFLSSEIQCLLMDIEEHLGSLSFQLKLSIVVEGYKPNKIPELLSKIGQDIDQLRKKGIDVGF